MAGCSDLFDIMSTLSVLTMPSFTEAIQSLTNLIWKPKQYVDLTAASSANRLLEYDIIIIGGGMLPFS